MAVTWRILIPVHVATPCRRGIFVCHTCIIDGSDFIFWNFNWGMVTGALADIPRALTFTNFVGSTPI